MSILRENPIAEELIQIGMQEGLRDGERKGLQEGLLVLLEDRFGALPEDFRDRVKAIQDTGKLRTLLRGAVRAASLQEFSAEAGV